MRKNLIKMMVVIGVAALILPTAVMAEWEQEELHENQADHSDLAIDHSLYDMDSAVGYDIRGDGTATSSFWTSKGLGAPDNTTPCPWNIGTGSDPASSAGTCPSQTVSWDNDQTGGAAGYASDDVELFGVILDDLYQSLTETAVLDTVNTQAFKKVDQVLDILFYRSNTAGEAFGIDGWHDTLPTSGTHWFGGVGMDQTLDQDVADVSGTTSSPNGTDRFSSDPTKLWAYDHVAQTFYQDFRLWDKGNTFGPLNSGFGNTAQNYSPRMRHGMELLALCRGGGECSDYDIESNVGDAHLYTTDLDAADFAFFDQWVIQSLKDSYTYGDLAVDADGDNDPDAGFTTGSVVLMQSYSSWMVQGAPGDLCASINTDGSNSVGCNYTYAKGKHEVVKDIALNTSAHQTGDP